MYSLIQYQTNDYFLHTFIWLYTKIFLTHNNSLLDLKMQLTGLKREVEFLVINTGIRKHLLSEPHYFDSIVYFKPDCFITKCWLSFSTTSLAFNSIGSLTQTGQHHQMCSLELLTFSLISNHIHFNKRMLVNC